MSDNELKVRDLRGLDRPAAEPTTMITVIRDALNRGVAVDQLKELLAMKRELDAAEAEKQFNTALAGMHAAVPNLLKTKVANRERGGKWNYAGHDEVTIKLCEAMAPFGLSHQWLTKQEKGYVTVTCRLMHSGGHKVETSMTAPDDTSGLKNPAQAICSTKTLLERYTLLGITGVSTRELGAADDDGMSASPQKPAYSGEGETKPAIDKPQGYADWQSSAAEKATQGMITLSDFWKTSARAFKVYCDAHDRPWWEALKAVAQSAPPEEKIP
jgi:hypothetical protein